ncbi:hypothetical protein AD998_21545 [bacterium 336/3]|nr:hypothetical protein AD998_21545 [bacterium 336/3]
MKKYFTHNGSNAEGPFSLEELKLKDFHKDTPIWYEGLSKWACASNIKELNDFLELPSLPIHKKSSKTSERNGSFIGLSILLIALVVLVAVLYNHNQGTKQKSIALQGQVATYEEKVMDIQEQEGDEPSKFLKLTWTSEQNFWGDKIRITGAIYNTAQVATYKDVVIKVYYYTKTETLLKEENYTIYDFFKANSSKDFLLKVRNYQDAQSLQLEIVSALPN